MYNPARRRPPAAPRVEGTEDVLDALAMKQWRSRSSEFRDGPSKRWLPPLIDRS
jgi:hypothetical protein